MYQVEIVNPAIFPRISFDRWSINPRAHSQSIVNVGDCFCNIFLTLNCFLLFSSIGVQSLFFAVVIIFLELLLLEFKA